MKKEEIRKNRLLGDKISRKQAIKKTGITALTAASLFFLETKSASATSQDSAPRPGDNWRM